MITWWLFTDTDYPVYPPNKSQGPIVAFGDSLTEGVGANAGSDYVTVISQNLGLPIINAGRSGDTTLSAMSRLNEEVLAQNPRLVILFLGGNDGLHRFPPEETFARLATMIDLFHSHDIGVLLIGIKPSLFSREYNRRFKKLALEKKVSFVPDILNDIYNKPDLMSDPIHPNNAGYKKVAEKIEPVLAKMLGF